MYLTIAEATKIYEDLKPKAAKAKAEFDAADKAHADLYAKAKASKDPQSFARELATANNNRVRLEKIYLDIMGQAMRAKMDINYINSGNGRDNMR